MNRLVAVAAFLALSTVSASAAPPADLVAAYKAGVAAVKCDIQLASDASSKLGDAVQKVEQKSGLAQADLDALWAETEASADADKAGFCAGAEALIAKVSKGGG